MKDELAKIAERCEQALEPLPVASPFARDLREIMGMVNRLSSSPVEEAPADVADVLARLRSWDHCYPGNINIEMAMQDAERVITRLSADLAVANLHAEYLIKSGARQAADLADARKVIENSCLAAEYWAGCDEGCDPDTASSEIMRSGGAWPAEAYDTARQWLSQQGDQSS